MEHNRDCDTLYGNSKFADFPPNVDNKFQKNMCNQSTNTTESPYTISNQKAHADCRKLRCHSGAIQAYQTSRYGNPHFDSARWPWPDCLPKRTSQNEKTRAAKQHFLVANTWKSSKIWASHPKTDTKPQRYDWTHRKRKTQSTREHRISKQISQTIWLDWHTSNRNKRASNWRYFGRLSWHFRQAQDWYRYEHGIQGETKLKRQ